MQFIFMEEIDSLDLEKMGPEFECHPRFPDRTNSEFVQVISRNRLKCGCGSGEAEKPGLAELVQQPVRRPLCCRALLMIRLPFR